LRQLARRQNRVQRGRQPHLCSQLYCVGQPTRMMLAANLDRFKRRSVRLSCPDPVMRLRYAGRL
jgi:hypothetical protein